MTRKVMDCREAPSEAHCTLTIAGEEGEVLDAAVAHAISVHGHSESPELREMLRGMLQDESPDAVTVVARGIAVEPAQPSRH
ncbi:DUF1059 domain-containing protein [Corallococcus sp. H22C18031201]|nr:DUF1059 domain-containing protein [Corallococcus sp. H22C18031201]